MIESGELVKDKNDVEWRLNAGIGERASGYFVKFKKKFPQPPHVVAALSYLDNIKEHNLRIGVKVRSVTKEGFEAVFTTWSDTRIYGSGVTWLAYHN